MLKVNLKTELDKLKEDHTKELTSLDSLTEVKQLLAGNQTEDLRILRALGASSEFMQMEAMTGKRLDLEKFHKEYKGSIFTREQIKSLAIDYRLRFLTASRFTGRLDIEVTAKIREFAKETNTEIDNWSLKTKYFILAPASMFKLDKHKVLNVAKKVVEDPILFYQVDNNHYRMIHKWGNDFSILRRLQGYKWKSSGNLFKFTFISALPIVTLFFAMCFSAPFIISNSLWFTLICVAGAAIIGGINFFNHTLSTDLNGNSNNDYLDFFSPNNWDSVEKLTK